MVDLDSAQSMSAMSASHEELGKASKAACDKYKDVKDKFDVCIFGWYRRHDYGVTHPPVIDLLWARFGTTVMRWQVPRHTAYICHGP
jgi:hypothetical protein